MICWQRNGAVEMAEFGSVVVMEAFNMDGVQENYGGSSRTNIFMGAMKYIGARGHYGGPLSIFVNSSETKENRMFYDVQR